MLNEARRRQFYTVRRHSSLATGHQSRNGFTRKQNPLTINTIHLVGAGPYVAVGRARAITGEHLSTGGKPLMEGYRTPVVAKRPWSSTNWRDHEFGTDVAQIPARRDERDAARIGQPGDATQTAAFRKSAAGVRTDQRCRGIGSGLRRSHRRSRTTV